MTNQFTAEMLREILDYDPETGNLYWKHLPRKYFATDRGWKCANSKCEGKEAFTTLDDLGYLRGHIFGKKVRGHQVAWAHYYGEWPNGEIDHENHVRSANWIKNLIDGSHGQNLHNQNMRIDNKSGVTGVGWHKRAGKHVASIKHNGKDVHLGLFSNKEDAIAVRKSAEQDFGYHPNHGMAI